MEIRCPRCDNPIEWDLQDDDPEDTEWLCTGGVTPCGHTWEKDYCPCRKCFGCNCLAADCTNAKKGKCGCKAAEELRETVATLMKTHGTRSFLATIIEILQECRVDEIDDKLIKGLNEAGMAYAGSMGLQWWVEEKKQLEVKFAESTVVDALEPYIHQVQETLAEITGQDGILSAFVSDKSMIVDFLTASEDTGKTSQHPMYKDKPIKVVSYDIPENREIIKKLANKLDVSVEIHDYLYDVALRLRDATIE